VSADQKNEPKPAWLAEAADCWRRLPNKAFFFPLLLAWLVLFHFFGNSILGYVHSPSLFAWLDNSYHPGGVDSDDAFGELIPLVVIGLMWWKRRELLALPLQTWRPGIFFLLAGIGLHLFGFALQQPRFSVVGMFVGIFGLMGLTWGRAWLRANLSIFWLCIFCVPLSALLLPLTFPLRLFVTWAVALVSNALTIDVVRRGTLLFGPGGSFQYDVAPACSGMRSLIAIFLLTAVYGLVAFRSPRRRWQLMALSVPLAVLGNVLRMLCIVFAAEMGGQQWGDFVHEGCPIQLPFALPVLGHEIAVANLLPYVPAILGFIFIGRRMEKQEKAGA
jgi:exosortase